MKQLKKLAGLLLALTMVIGLTATAFAATDPTAAPTPTYNDNMQGTQTGGKITIEDAVVGQKYNIYQILYLESYTTANGGAYSYKANTQWEGWLKTDQEAKKYFSFNEQEYVTWQTPEGMTQDEAAAKFAKLALKHAEAEGSGITPINTQPFEATGSIVEFPNLKLGYYLLDSTLGTLCSLDTTNPTVTMEEKNEKPTNEKQVQEDSTGNYGKVNDAEIGQTVNFRSTVTLPAGSENVVYHDIMSEGLTLTENSVKVYTDEAMQTELEASKYTVDYNPEEHHNDDGSTTQCTFEVSFTQEYLDSLTSTATVYVKYSATINENAVIGDTGNTNESHLSYGDESNTTNTPGSTTTTYTWSFDVFKYTNTTPENGGNPVQTPLAGVKFVLLNADKSKAATFDGNGKLTGWKNLDANGNPYNEVTEDPTDVIDVSNPDNWPDEYVLTSNVDGEINVSGLDSGIYYLREIKTLAGYNMVDDKEVKIEPTTSGTGEDMTMTLAPVTINVLNNTGDELPGTGGIGTTIFYVVGSILLVGAVVLLIVKKRMSVSK